MSDEVDLFGNRGEVLPAPDVLPPPPPQPRIPAPPWSEHYVPDADGQAYEDTEIKPAKPKAKASVEVPTPNLDAVREMMRGDRT